MNISEFKQAVASFVGREPEYFAQNADGSPGSDKLLIAINNAKVFLQRQIDFEYARGFADGVYHVTGGAGEGLRLTQCVRHETSDPVSVKKVQSMFTPHGFERLLSLRQKTFRGVTDLVRGSFERNGDMWVPDCRPGYASLVPHRAQLGWTAVWGHTFRDPIFYQHGKTILLYPKPRWFQDENCNDEQWPADKRRLPFVLDIVELMPPYREPYIDNGDSRSDIDGKRPEPWEEDFILESCYDYMLWRSIAELNVFLKDGDQVSVSQGKMTEALENIRAWNADLINAGYDIE